MTAHATPDSALGSIAQGDRPVFEQLVAMNLDSLTNSGLDAKTYFLARLAALVAMDAPPVSYVITLGLAKDVGVTYEEAQGTLVAVAPVVGGARVAAAAGNILRGLFGVAALEEAEEVPEQRSTS